MKRAELIDKLEALPANELAAIASVKLTRGRPSNTLRQALIEDIIGAIAAKRLSVKKDGTVVKKAS